MNLSLTSLPGLLSLVAIVGFVYLAWKQAGGVADKQTSDAYKNLVAAREKEIEELKKQIHDQSESFRKQIQEQGEAFRVEINGLRTTVGELTGKLSEKNDRIKTLEENIQNRNPEMEAFIKSSSQHYADMRNFMQNINAYVTTQAAVHNVTNSGK